MKKQSPINILAFSALLMAFWLIMSGYYDAFHISVGVLCVILVVFTNAQLMQHQFSAIDLGTIGNLRWGYALYYLFWLMWQILLSGIQVSKVVLTPRYHNQTCILKFKVNYPNVQAKVILGNSITLTPGTVTLRIDGDEFTVHALTPNSYGGIVDDSMPRKVLKLYSKEDRQVVSDVRFFYSQEDIA